MDFQTFFSIFERCKRERNGEGLVDILKNSRKYFQNISGSDSGYVLATLFDIENGILHFLRHELNKGITIKIYETAIIQGFNLVEFIMDQFQDEYEPYIIPTKELCEFAIEIRCVHYVKKAAASVFKKLIQLFKDFELLLGQTVEKFGKKLHLYVERERSEIFIVMAAIAKHNPTDVERFSNEIFKKILEDMKVQYKDHNISQSARFQEYFEALKNLLEYFTPYQNEEKDKQYYEEVYIYIKNICQFDEKSYELNRSKRESALKFHEKKRAANLNTRLAVELLIRHWSFFGSMIYKDYKFWQKKFEYLLDQSGKTKELGGRAMKAFYKAIAQRLKTGDTAEERKILLYFREYFLNYLTRLDLDSNLLQLIVWAYSQMAAPCKKHLTTSEVYDMYSLVSRRSISLYTSDDANIEEIPSYLESISEILINLPDVSVNQIKLLSKLGILLIKRFPELKIFIQPSAIKSLIKSLSNMGYLNQNLQQEYFYDLIYNGIIWTCSHTLYIDAELARSTLTERPICYKNYLPLWEEILNLKYYKIETGPLVIKHLCKELFDTCMELINSLNLKIQTKNDAMFSDVALSLTAENETDFRIFINMVDLYEEIFKKLEFSQFEDWLPKLLYEIVKNSYKHPMVSGFYKLAHTILQTSGTYWKSLDAENETFELMSRFLSSTLDLICGFYHELQIACVYLILDAPINLIQDKLQHTVPVFKIALTIGLSDFSLAACALDALELWTRELSDPHSIELKEFLREIVPSLEPYLQSKESATELLQDILKTQRKNITHVTLKDETKTLEEFQRRILLFLGSLSSEITQDFVYKRSQDTKATWDKKDLLEHTLFFPDYRLHIHFDSILPRVIELALSSGDRRTRMCACEVLHSLIIMILGKTRDILNRPNPDRFAHLYKILCPAMLKLGSDPDSVVRQLYFPTLLQLTHWLSSKLMLKSPSTIYLVDALFDGLTDESNSSLRDFSGMCLKEFLDWSIKQSSDKDLRNSTINIHTIVRKICTYALHPSMQKRIAAAIAFNHLYASLREREEILNIYWLEIFYCVVKSSEGFNDLGIENAIGHLEKVLKIKSKLFNTENSRRRKPIDFETANLKSAAIWLLTQCGSVDRSYRKRCMKLLESINPLVENCNTVEKLVSLFLENHGIEDFNSIFLKDLNEKVEEISLENVKALLRSLDCYIWFIEKKLIDSKFIEGNPEKDRIFSSVNEFIKCFMNRSEIEENGLLISKELELLKTLTCETIVTLFSFCHKILNATVSLLDSTLLLERIPEYFWSQDLFSMISICVLNPQEMGFDTKNLEIMESLPQKMDELLHVLKDKAPKCLLEKLLEEFGRNVEEYYETITNVKNAVGMKIEMELKLNVKGFTLLHKGQYLDLILKGSFDETKLKLIEDIFNILKDQDERNVVFLKPDTVEYLESILELVLTNYDSSLINTLMGFIMNETLLSNQDMTNSQHGEYFLSVFKAPIFHGMLKNVQETMKIMDDLLEKNPQKLLMVIEELTIFIYRHKKNYVIESESLANEILKRCSLLQRIVNNFEYRKKQFMNIYRIVVRLKRNPLEIANNKHDLYLWILQKLQENIDLEQKTAILDDFLICLTDINSDPNSELSLLLRCLKHDRPENVSNNDINSLKASACFQTMLTHLPLTKSVVLFETIITFAAGSCDQLCNEKTSIVLENYFRLINRESVLKSLEIAYKFFMNCGTLIARFDILQRFLLPSFQFCKAIDIELFFEKNAKEVYSILTQELKSEIEEDLKRLIISKIGSYNLFEIMFARVNLEKITSVGSRIAKNVFENPEDKQLMKTLMLKTLSERRTKCLHPNTVEITRLLHCAAYNCQIAIVSLKEEEKFYSWIFMENRQEESLIWEKIVDCEKQYSLQQTFKEYPKQKKKLINIKKRSRGRSSADEENQTYIYKYDLASSTLAENINSYDFNEATLLPKSDQVEETMSLTFECDDFNEHECMAPVSGILVHMVRSEIFIPQEGQNVEFPKWMGSFFRSMKTSFNNVRLFLLKVICNTQNIFKPYGKFFVGIILNTVNEYLKQNSLNYIITDILLVLIDWQVALPENHAEQAQNLVEHLVDKADAIGNRSVRKYNVEIIKMTLQLWGEKLTLPKAIDRKKESAPDFTIGLILTFLENKLQDQVVARSDLVEFVQNSFENWKREEDVVLQNCAALGLIAKYLEDENEAENEENTTKQKINEVLCLAFRKMQTADKNRLIKCINILASSYPPWIANFFEFVRNNIGEVDNVGKAKCLEIFLSLIPSLTVAEVKRELGYLNFNYLLKNKILTCERVGLEIIGKLVSIQNSGDMIQMAELAVPYLKNDSSDLREKAYDIFMKIKNKYGDDITIEYDTIELQKLSNKVLLIGLLDTTENLHEKLMHFWTDDVSLPEKLVDRLLILLKQYSPDVEEVFLLYFCLSILRLTKKSKEYDEKMFPEKLEECTFVDYKIMMHWRAKNLGSMAPLFARSLASQMSQMFSQSTSTLTISSSLNMQLLRATVGPAFEPTALQDSTFSETQSRFVHDSDSDLFKMPDPAYNKVSKRFLGLKETSNEILQNTVKTNRHHDEMVKEEVIRQSNVVKLYRNYRIGDFPDVQISHSSLLVPLQELAKKDWLICKDLVVSIVCSLLRDWNMRSGNEQFITEIFSRLREILENNRGSSSTLAAVLEITLSNQVCVFEPDLVGRVSKISGLYSLGALYLEKYMIYGSDLLEPPRKRRRDENLQENSNPSIYLARLYESMNEFDIVLSIFKSGQFSEKLQEASLAQSAGDFLRAKKAYEEAYEIENGFVKEHCLQESFECLCQLSQWDILDKKIFDESQKDFNNVWNDPEKEEWLLPWIFRVELHKLLRGDLFKNRDTERLKQFLECIIIWSEGDELPRIKRRFGEEMANILMINVDTERPEMARDFLKSNLDDARENWLRLNPLSEKLRSRLLLKLRGISSIDLFLKTLKSSNLRKGTCDLMKEWSQNLPSSNDDLLPWETHINYRVHFAAFLMGKGEFENNRNIQQKLKSIQIEQKMRLLDFAIEHRNRFIAKNYVIDLEEAIKASGTKNLEFHLSTSKCYRLMGEFVIQDKKKISHFSNSWKYVHNHLQANKNKVTLRISALQHVNTLTLLLEKLIDEGGKTAEMLINSASDFTSRFTDEEITGMESFRKKIIDYGLAMLKESCEIAEKSEKANCYFKLVTYCYNRVSRNEDIEQIREFVSATLKAMIYGSFKAAHYFPCLLKSEYLQDEVTKEIFIEECQKIETWLFITWQSQILSHLGGPLAEILIPIIDRLIQDYPNAVMYSFRLTIESNPDLLLNPRILLIKQKLYNKPGVESFLSAMHYIAQPEIYLMHHLSEVLSTVQQGKSILIEKLLETLFPEETSLCGSLFKDAAKKISIFRPEIETVNDKTFEELKLLVKKIKDFLKKSLKEREANGKIFQTKLKDYSSWLQKLSGSDIEVPGQYLSNRKPLPRYHAKIGKIESNIVVMKSLRKPIKITIVGNDAKNYSFLVKFGEDLRLDQRIQQVFTIMNNILQNDIPCGQRHLAIDTYQVIPFSLSLGLIVWIEGMKTLEDFIHFTLTEEQQLQCSLIMEKYDGWIRKSLPGKSSVAYKESLIKYDALQVVTKMNEFIKLTEWDSLRKTFFALSPSVESFLSLRHNFVSTYGTICTAQWILGIGDRHLENLLVSVKSGRCLGIDFGFAFGAGVDICIPELMPFRLTPQIQGLLKPFAENGPFETTMIYVLKALRKEKGPLMACLDVFIHEPLNWLEQINKLSKENHEEFKDINWLPKKRVGTVEQKLDGKKPSLITLEELKLVHGNQKYFWRYVDIVQGTEEDHKTLRAKVKTDNLTPEEQVQCLIDQATDFNILGRTYKGWQPWM